MFYTNQAKLPKTKTGELSSPDFDMHIKALKSPNKLAEGAHFLAMLLLSGQNFLQMVFCDSQEAFHLQKQMRKIPIGTVKSK